MTERRFRKKELLSIIGSLREINRHLGRLLQDGEGIPGDVLEECQQAAIAVGDCLEGGKNSDRSVIGMLEDYCENVYQLSLCGDEGRGRELVGEMQIRLGRIEGRIEEQLPPDKKEIVFFPYKAAMWDSLESVWRAASEDEGCEVFVVPIPYFDKNPDGTFGQMHDESGRYPADVPVTSWKEYDPAKRRPDVVYIHNPYDQCNYVTSVHPDFYAAKLRKCTNMLVYIPYFITDGDVPEAFCVTPGVLFAHKVIVQSEETRRRYIEELHRFEKENGGFAGMGKVGLREVGLREAGEKVVALGSPKYDKVLSERPEDFSVPEEWRRLIEGQGGRRKKVVFYNTTIDSFLNFSEHMLDKIDSVLKVFKAFRDTVLLWRPHPLLKAALASMRPELLCRYEEMEEAYRAEGWGIYDDSADLHRAIALSDAYYGDGSSVALLYRETGKPVMLQNPRQDGLELETDEETPYLVGLELCRGRLYGIHYYWNMMFELEPEAGNMHYFASIPGKCPGSFKRYQTAKAVGDKLYFAPFMEKDLVICDVGTGEFEIHDLGLREERMTEGTGNFYNLCLHGERLFLIPCGYKEMVSFDLRSGEVCRQPLPEACFSQGEGERFYSYEYLDNSRILLPSLTSNKILIFDLDSGGCELIKIGGEDDRFSAIKKYKDDYWLVAKNKLKLLRWNYCSGEVEEIMDFPEGCLEDDQTCFDEKTVCLYGQFLYCFPGRSNMAVKVNLDTEEIEEIGGLKTYCGREDMDRGRWLFDGGVMDGGVVYLHYQKELIVAFDLRTEKAAEYSRRPGGAGDEGGRLEEGFLHQMFLTGENRSCRPEAEETAGMKIHRRVMEYADSAFL